MFVTIFMEKWVILCIIWNSKSVFFHPTGQKSVIFGMGGPQGDLVPTLFKKVTVTNYWDQMKYLHQAFYQVLVKIILIFIHLLKNRMYFVMAISLCMTT